MSYFGLNKLSYLREIIRHHGGYFKAFYKLWIMDDLKIGTHMGTDKFGNKYFENNRNFFGRNRWVEYSLHVRLDYDASMVCPEWYGWLHYKTDIIPTRDKSRPKHKWMLDDTENYTGTRCQYVPYSTRMQKIGVWMPPVVSKRDK